MLINYKDPSLYLLEEFQKKTPKSYIHPKHQGKMLAIKVKDGGRGRA
jgi:hypothetical protein